MKSSLALLAVLGLLPMAQAQTPPPHPAHSGSDGPAPGSAVYHAALPHPGSSRASDHLLYHGSHGASELTSQRT